MRISTPGGMDIGVRPSFEGLLTVFENWRRGVVVVGVVVPVEMLEMLVMLVIVD